MQKVLNFLSLFTLLIAATIVEEMENNNIVSSANHVGKREILISEQG